MRSIRSSGGSIDFDDGHALDGVFVILPSTCPLCSSPVRLFRLAGTLTASHLMSGWVEVHKAMAKDLAQTQFQADAEAKKKALNKVGVGWDKVLAPQ